MLIVDLRSELALFHDHLLDLGVAHQEREDASRHGDHQHDAHKGEQRLDAVLTAAARFFLVFALLALLLLAAQALLLGTAEGVLLHGAVVDLGAGEALGSGFRGIIRSGRIGAAAILKGPGVAQGLRAALRTDVRILRGTALCCGALPRGKQLGAVVRHAAGGRLLHGGTRAAANCRTADVVVVRVQSGIALVDRHGVVLLF